MSDLLLFDEQPFLPTRISGGAALWLDASDTSTITESSGSVSQWNDKSGNSYNFPQGTGSAQPTTNATTQNGKNVLDFDGSDSLVGPSGLYSIPSGDNTMFVVSKRNVEDATSQRMMTFEDGGATVEFLSLSGS